jgi:asparaginyl-tRNA synthetase
MKKIGKNDLRIKDILQLDASNQEMEIYAWVRTKRDSKGLIFLELNDGSCLKNIQVIFDFQESSVPSEFTDCHTGSAVKVSGVLVSSPGKNQSVELQGNELELIGTSDPELYPLQKKRHSFEFLREIAHLRPRTNTFGAVTRVRNALSTAVHKFFQDRSFLWIHTPIITASDAEGAGQMFQVTTLPLEKMAKADPSRFEQGIDFSRDFFGKPSYLTVSGQLSVENFACSMERVYTFGPTFRAENSNTSRHLAEFWMIEPEIAFCDIEANMDLAEDFLKEVLSYVMEHCSEDMDFFNLRIEKGILETLQQVVSSEFKRITYTDAISILDKQNAKFEFPVSWGTDLQSEHERFLTEEVFKGPVIVCDYPKEIKAFYMKLNDDEKTVRAMDVLVPRLGEIIGGSERENRLEVLTNRIKESGLNEKDYWWYLDLRRFGSVPHSGFGLGFERLIQYITGMANIRDVIPFPRTPKNAQF